MRTTEEYVAEAEASEDPEAAFVLSNLAVAAAMDRVAEMLGRMLDRGLQVITE
jgi:hypothetical protein